MGPQTAHDASRATISGGFLGSRRSRAVTGVLKRGMDRVAWGLGARGCEAAVGSIKISKAKNKNGPKPTNQSINPLAFVYLLLCPSLHACLSFCLVVHPSGQQINQLCVPPISTAQNTTAGFPPPTARPAATRSTATGGASPRLPPTRGCRAVAAPGVGASGGPRGRLCCWWWCWTCVWNHT